MGISFFLPTKSRATALSFPDNQEQAFRRNPESCMSYASGTLVGDKFLPKEQLLLFHVKLRCQSQAGTIHASFRIEK